MKFTSFLLLVVAAALVWAMDLQRRLQAAQMRGDMYRDISTRLDKRVADLLAGERGV